LGMLNAWKARDFVIHGSSFMVKASKRLERIAKCSNV